MARLNCFAIGEAHFVGAWRWVFNLGNAFVFMWNVERLEVYSRVCGLIVRVYVLIRMLPNEEKFALGNQMRRAAVSVKLNMIEGSGKRTSREFVSYLGNAMGSLKEVRGQIEIGVDLGYFGGNGKREVAEIRRIERLLFGYIKYVEKKDVK